MPELPSVSFIVLAYKQERFIREAVRSALAQTYSNLEIILSDDGSPDHTFEIIAEEIDRYNGPHKVVLNRNSNNLGIAGNLNRAIELASGDLLVIQGGDDISIPTRTSRLVQAWVRVNPHRELIYSNVIRISDDGSILQQQLQSEPMKTIEQVIRGDWYVAKGCAAAYSRSLFDKYGPLHPDVQYEDYVLTFRALLGNGCEYIDEPLVYYRLHEGSFTYSRAQFSVTRSAVAKRSKHVVAEHEERLRAWDLSNRREPYLRWRLARDLSLARLEARSSMGSRSVVLGCVFHAITSGRPRIAWTFFWRDLLRPVP